MDKKNVQNRYTKTLLTDEIFLLDIENLWSQIKPKIKNLTSYFFIFFAEKYLDVFSVTSIWKFLVTLKHQKTSKNSNV